MSTKHISEVVYDEIIRFYQNVNISAKDKSRVVMDVTQLYLEYQTVKGACNRSRPMYDSEKIKKFENKLENLFDILLANSVLNENARIFLESQREPWSIK